MTARIRSSRPIRLVGRRRRLPDLVFEQAQVDLLEGRLFRGHRLNVGTCFDEPSHNPGGGDGRRVDADGEARAICSDIAEPGNPPARGRAGPQADQDHAHPRAEQTRPQGRRSVDGHQARAKDRHTIGHTLDFVEVVRRDEHRAPLVAQTQHELADLTRALGIEAGCRLVEQDDVRVVQQRTRERHALLQPLRQLGGGVARAVADVKRVQRFVDRPLRGRQPMEPRVHEQILPYAQALPEAGRFGEESDPTAEPGRVLRRQRVPPKRTVPDEGSIRPASIRSVVVLPAPFGPSSAKTSPGTSSNDTSSTATRVAEAPREM